MQVARNGDLVYIQVIGRGSFQNASHVKHFSEEVLKNGAKEIVIDLKECTYLDSTFLGTLAGIGIKLRAATAEASTLQLLNATARNTELIQNLGLDRLFRFETSAPVPAPETTEKLDGTAAGKVETGETMLEAHETLMQWDARNVAKFKDVVAYLKEDLGQTVD
ncbi:STAS domain-containing protein [Verrucomicrobium sp. GAS474]|uniref:STAS domain-containing protein n=1 Tax=Verrucomicrobium sp. GAS474 TaxID=1882831 RepID=UPI0031B608F8